MHALRKRGLARVEFVYAAKVGSLRELSSSLCCAMQGTLTIFEDHESLTPVLSYNLAVCSLKSEETKLFLTRTEKYARENPFGACALPDHHLGPVFAVQIIP